MHFLKNKTVLKRDKIR